MAQDPVLYLGADANGVKPEYSPRLDRQLPDVLLAEGVYAPASGNLLVTQRPAGANMSVNVAAGPAFIAGDDIANQGKYFARCTAAENIIAPAAPASNSRVDMLVYRVYDYGSLGTGLLNLARFEVISGAVAASPTAPAVPSTAIPLAQWTVTSTTTSITTAMLTDLRAAGGPLAVATPVTAAQIAAQTAADRPQGRLFENVTTGKVQHVLTAGALPVDVAQGLQVVKGTYTGDNSSTRNITVGVAPQVLFLAASNGFLFVLAAGLSQGSLNGGPNATNQTAANTPILTSTGFTVGYQANNNNSSNTSGVSYQYLAIG